MSFYKSATTTTTMLKKKMTKEKSSEETSYYALKLVMLGESGVGKTALMMRYTNGTFAHSMISTIGLDFKSKKITIDDNPVKLQLWDTAGQERFQSITCSYMRGVNGVLLVFDLSNERSFVQIKEWLRKEQFEMLPEDIPCLLVGNKCDNPNRQISQERAKAFAAKLGFTYIETSALHGYNVNEAFMQIAKQAWYYYVLPADPPPVSSPSSSPSSSSSTISLNSSNLGNSPSSPSVDTAELKIENYPIGSAHPIGEKGKDSDRIIKLSAAPNVSIRKLTSCSTC